MEDEGSFNLPAFNLLPKPCVEWPDGPKAKQAVTSLEYCNEQLYIGSSEGRVFMYSLDKVSQWELQGTSAVNDKKSEGMSLGLGKKPVERLIAIPDIGRLLVLCNETVTSHALDNLSLKGPLAKAKGASLMCVGFLEGAHYVVTVKKRKLMVWTLNTSGKEGVEPVSELDLPDEPRQICMCGPSVCIGYAREYRIFRNVHTPDRIEESPLFPVFTSMQIPPFLATMDDDTMLLSAEDMCMIVDSNGNPARAPLTVSGQVLAYARSRPYVVALQQGSIDVFNLEKQSVVQMIPCPEPFHAIADAGPGARGHGQKIFVASEKKVYCLDPMPFEDQVDMLMGAFHVGQAFDLFRQTMSDIGGDRSELAARAAKMRSDAAFCLLSDLDTDQAIKHFKRSPVDVCELLVLVPGVLPKSFSYTPKESYNPMVKYGLHLEDMVKMALTRKTGNEIGEGDHDMVEEQLRKVKLMLCEFLEFKRDAANDGMAAVHAAARFDDERMNLAGEVQVRPQKLSRELLKVIETALLALYTHTSRPNEFIIAHIRRAGKLCGLTEGVNPLMVGLRYTALGTLYQVHGDNKKALGVWKKIGSGKLKEEGCDGIVPTVDLLAQLDDKEMVLEFAEWVLEKNPDQAVRIFAERPQATANLIDATTVLALLEKLGSVVIQRYLEFLIHKQQNAEEQYHTKLALAYTDQVLQMADGLESAAAMAVRKKLQAFLKSPSCRTAFVVSLPVILCIGTFCCWRHHSVVAARSHCAFSRLPSRPRPPQKLMPKIQGTAMVDELVLLYRGMGQHDKALSVRPCTVPLCRRSLQDTHCRLCIRLATDRVQAILNKNAKESAQEAKQYCLDNAPPCKPGEVPESLFTDLLKIYFNSEDPEYVPVQSCSLSTSPSTHSWQFPPVLAAASGLVLNSTLLAFGTM